MHKDGHEISWKIQQKSKKAEKEAGYVSYFVHSYP